MASSASQPLPSGSAELSPILLRFVDPLTEERYRQFCYNTADFFRGKIWHVVTLMLAGIFFVDFNGMRQGFHKGMFTSRYWIGLTINTVITVFMLGALFVKKLQPYREQIYLVSLFTHWPAFTVMEFFGLGDPWHGRYAGVVECLYFCTFVVQPRFAVAFFFLMISPVVTLVAATSSIRSYWTGLSYFEVCLWLLLCIPAFALRMFERNSRRSFVKLEKCEVQIEQINAEIGRTEALIVAFFAKTPTRDFLADGKRAIRVRKYPDTTLLLTDLENFTSWSSRSAPHIVIKTLSEMFSQMELWCTEYDVEKVSTIGDAFQGAAFPSSTPKPVRVSRAIQFCIRALTSANPLKMRVGIHIGTVTAAFVGSQPPKFDLFGEAVEITQELESQCIPGKVHASTKLMAAVAGYAGPIGEDVQNTDNGLAFSEWALAEDQNGADDMINPGEDGTGGFFSDKEVYNVCQALIKLSKGSARAEKRRRWEIRERQRRGMDSQVGGLSMTQSMEASMESIEMVEDIDEGSIGAGAGATLAPRLPNTTGTQGELDALIEKEAEALPPASSRKKRANPPLQSDDDSGSASQINSTSIDMSPLQQVPHQNPLLAAETLSVGSSASSRTQQSSNYSHHSIRSSSYDAEGEEDAVEMNPYFLYFKNPNDEKSFKAHLQRTGIVKSCVAVLLLQEAGTLVAFAGLSCTEHIRNRVLLCVMLLALFLHVLLFAFRVAQHRQAFVTIPTFLIIATCAHFSDATCTSTANPEFYRRALVRMFTTNTLLASQFMLQNRLTHRLALSSVIVWFDAILALARYGILGETENVDPLGLFGRLPVMAFISFFADYSVRAAFASQRRLQKTLYRYRSRYQETARAAVHVMLPEFTIEKLVRENYGDDDLLNDDSSGHDAETDALIVDAPGVGHVSGSRQGRHPTPRVSDESIAALGAKGKDVLWHFDYVSVMFITFSPPPSTYINDDMEEIIDRDQQFVEISDTISQLETVLRGTKIHKLKSIASTFMCVSGLDGERNSTVAMAAAALNIVKEVFLAKTEWHFAIGIHSGPCLGAVLGRQSMTFDVFGDTVNVASRMCTTAKAHTIQMSRRAALQCSDEPAFGLRRNEAIVIKGKGAMTTFTLSGR